MESPLVLASPSLSRDEAGRRGRDIESRPTTLPFDEDIYDAVLVAAFGGVSMEVGKHDRVTVPPIFLAFFWVPLFAVQFALALFLCLDMDLDSPIRTGHEDEEMEISTQLLLVIIVNISFFHQMLDTLKNLAFILNPITWTYIEHIPNQDWRTWTAYVVTTLPCTAVAVLAKLMMLHWVSSLSTSIILACPDVKESIFNCLAIAFIVQLGESTWRFSCDSFFLQFDVEPGGLQVRRAKRCGFRWLVWRCRARAENIFAVIGLFALYSWHFVIVMIALDTNILPVARDVCYQWRFLNHTHDTGGTEGFLGVLLRWIERDLVGFIRDPKADVNRKADPQQGGICNEEYGTISWSEGRVVIVRHIQVFRVFLVVLFTLLVLPTLFRKCRVWKFIKKQRVSIATYVDDAAALARSLRAGAHHREQQTRSRGGRR